MVDNQMDHSRPEFGNYSICTFLKNAVYLHRTRYQVVHVKLDSLNELLFSAFIYRQKK